MALARADAAAARVPLYEHLATLVSRRQGRHDAARADDEHPQRRRARRQQRRLPGVHGDAGRRRRRSPRRCRAGAEIFHALRGILKKKGYSTGVGDEGGFAPSLKSNREAVDVVLEAIGKAGYKPGENVYLALDVAASELWNDERPQLRVQEVRRTRTKTADQMVALYEDWIRQYPIISIEDGLAEGDWDGWATLTKALGRPRAARRRRHLRDQPGDPQARHRRGRRQRDPRQAEPDRHGHRDARLRRDGARRRLRERHLAPLGRDRGHDDRRPRRRRPTPARSRPARRAAPTASRSTTSCCGSRRSSARAAATPGRARIKATL